MSVGIRTTVRHQTLHTFYTCLLISAVVHQRGHAGLASSGDIGTTDLQALHRAHTCVYMQAVTESSHRHLEHPSPRQALSPTIHVGVSTSAFSRVHKCFHSSGASTAQTHSSRHQSPAPTSPASCGPSWLQATAPTASLLYTGAALPHCRTDSRSPCSRGSCNSLSFSLMLYTLSAVGLMLRRTHRPATPHLAQTAPGSSTACCSSALQGSPSAATTTTASQRRAPSSFVSERMQRHANSPPTPSRQRWQAARKSYREIIPRMENTPHARMK